MTATAAEIDTTVLTELEFEPPCEVRWEQQADACEKPAKWIMKFIVCCGAGLPVLACDQHKDEAMTTTHPAQCKTCGRTVASPFRKAVKSIEPLKGGAS